MYEEIATGLLGRTKETIERQSKREAHASKIKAITDEVMAILHSNSLSVNDADEVIRSIEIRLGKEAHL